MVTWKAEATHSWPTHLCEHPGLGISFQTSRQNSPNISSRLEIFYGAWEKAEEQEIKICNIRQIIEKAREFQKNICFVDYTKAFDCGSQQTVENS